MADATGATDEAKGPVLTKADLDKAVAEAVTKAKAEAATEAYRKAQSEFDKKAALTNKELAEFKRKQLDALPEAERSKAMLEEVYKRLTESTPVKDDSEPKTPEKPTATDAEKQAEAAQAALKKIAKEQGLDPDKLDFSSEERFIKSILGQKKDESDPNGGPVDSGTHSVGKGARDMKNLKPEDLIRSGLKNWKPVRGKAG